MIRLRYYIEARKTSVIAKYFYLFRVPHKRTRGLISGNFSQLWTLFETNHQLSIFTKFSTNNCKAYNKVQTTTTYLWDNWYFFVKKIWTLQFLSYIDILYTIRLQIECTFRISRFQTHLGNRFGEKIKRSRKKALFLQKINAHR